MIAIPQQPAKMTIEEYLAWELDQDIRYEYNTSTAKFSP
jgi:hypothetical protein